ncbi:unnamed protein product [Brassicogethes aeneus]|uniref:Uncharacterized protein n=1 Tax=Brassicogethes aeneus TaxID=1431903 RepID=A0A9P0FEL1_BRAAE|nr:unnamed protein product [Brassicogethes aeneus]
MAVQNPLQDQMEAERNILCTIEGNRHIFQSPFMASIQYENIRKAYEMNTIIRTLSQSHPVRAKLIKFRYGSMARDQNPKPSAAAAAPGQAAAKGAAGNAEPIYDFQLPPRWRRQPLDEKEIDAINSGGAY